MEEEEEEDRGTVTEKQLRESSKGKEKKRRDCKNMNKARENQRPKYVAVVGEGRQFGTESCVEEVHYKEVQRCAKERSRAMGHLQDRSVAMKVK